MGASPGSSGLLKSRRGGVAACSRAMTVPARAIETSSPRSTRRRISERRVLAYCTFTVVFMLARALTLGQRAQPLIHLMEWTLKEGGFIIWEAAEDF